MLDTCSTCDVSNNPELVIKIKKCPAQDSLTAYTYGGAQRYDHLEYLPLLPLPVHFKNNSMKMILSLKSVSEIPGERLMMDTAVNKSIALQLKDGRMFVFDQYQNGLYYFDANTTVTSSKNKAELNNYSLLQTVTDKRTYFTFQEIKGADRSRKIHEYLFYPGENI